MKKWWKNKRGKEDKCNCNCHHHHGCMGGGYFLGFLGALIFYMQAGEGIMGVLKAIV